MRFYEGGPAFDLKAHSRGHSVDPNPPGYPSKTQQHEKDDHDINVIMRRFGLTGGMPAGLAGAVYGDFSGIVDFEDALELVEKAQGAFMSLPAELRQRFENDPVKLARYAQAVGPEEFERQFYQANVPGSVSKPLEGSSSAATGGAVVAPVVPDAVKAG